MKRFRKILIPIRGDRVRPPVLTQAARLAKQNDAAIKLIAIVEDLPWYSRLVMPATEELERLIIRNRSDLLEGLAQELRRDGLKVSVEVLTGRPHLETVREVEKGGHDLVMKEAEPNKSLLFGSTDMYLLQTCPCPLWILKPGHGDKPFSKILAAVDPLPPPDDLDLLHLKTEIGQKEESLDVKILDLAGSLAENDNAELQIIHAWSVPGEGLLRGEATLDHQQIDRYVEDSRVAAENALKRFLGKFPPGSVRRSVHLIKGNSADVIADFAKSAGIDLIVMGTVARTGIAGLLMGNTAQTILQRVDCSVLAVKPDGFVSPVA